VNYEVVRQQAKKKIEAKKAQLSQMSGEDRTKLEEALISEAHKEELARLKAEKAELEAKNSELAEQIKKSDEDAMKLLQENEDLEKKNGELQEKVSELETEFQEGKSDSAVQVEVQGSLPAEEIKKQTQQPQQQGGNQRQHKKR
jgi:chromosome segregation ATPase